MLKKVFRLQIIKNITKSVWIKTITYKADSLNLWVGAHFRISHKLCLTSMNWIGMIKKNLLTRTKKFGLTFAAISRKSCRTSTDVLRSGRRVWFVTGSTIYTRIWTAGGVSAWNVRKSLHERQKQKSDDRLNTHTGFAPFSLEYSLLVPL